MATTTIRSCGVATESTVGSVATATGYPDASGLSYAGLEVRRASLTTPGEQASLPREDARASAYVFPAEVPGIHSGGNPLRLRDGTVTLTVPLRTIGSATTYANYAAMPLGRLLASGFGVSTPGASSDTVASGGSATLYTSSDASNTTIGGLIKVDRDASGRVSFTTATNADPGGTELVTCSPAVEDTFAVADTLRLCNTYYSVLGTSTLGSTVALRLDGDGWRSYLVGARWQSTRLYLEESLLMADITVQGKVYDDHASASVSDYTQADGAQAVARGAFHVISSTAIGTTVPATLARTVLNLDAWELTIENTLAMVGRSDDALGYSDLEVVDQTVTGSITLTTPVTGYDDFLLDQEQRSMMFAFGPLGNGNGVGVYVPAATVTTDPSIRQLDGERVQQVLNFGMGNWTLDTGSTAPADTNFRLGLAL